MGAERIGRADEGIGLYERTFDGAVVDGGTGNPSPTKGSIGGAERIGWDYEFKSSPKAIP